MSIAIGELEILLRADVARLQRDMDSARRVVGDASNNMSQAAGRVKAALAGIAAGIGLSQLVQMSDAYAKFTAQLKLASLSAREYAAAYSDVKRISTQSTQGLQETGTLYARIANGTRELGTTQKQVAAITETVNLALLVSGATASEAASAQLQLSQAFASGTLRGEEFNAVNEAAPRLMLALADGIGVPVGALKKMAEEGAITSQIMAETLPNALAKLRQEAKEVQTIGGAFTVLKNNVMEFVGVQASASGAVSAFTKVLGLISSNLTLIAGAMATVVAAKLGTWLVAMTTEALAAAAAKRALATATLANAVSTTQAAAVIAAAKLAEAQANVRVTASASALAAARVTELRASVLAASGATQLAIVQNGLIPAQARAAALAQANAIALSAQAVAAAGATTASIAATGALGAQAAAATLGARAMGVLNATMAFFGGPIGLIITLLGAAATAWMVFGNKAKEANDKVAASLDETTTEMIARLDKQIEKLKERNRLQDQEPRIRGLKDLSEADRDGLARAKAALDANKEQMARATNTRDQMSLVSEQIALVGQYETALKRVGQVQDEVTAAATRGRNGDLKEWYSKNGTAAQRLAAELEELKKKFGEIPPEMEKLVRAKYADKGAATLIRQEATAYQNLVTAIGEKIAANKLEIAGIDAKTDAQKMSVKLDVAIATGKNKLTDKHIAEARALIAIVAAQDEQILAAAKIKEVNEKAVADSDAIIDAINDEATALKQKIKTYGMLPEAITRVKIAELEASKQSIVLTEAGIADIQRRIDALKGLADQQGASTAQDDNKKAIEENLKSQISMWESIDQTAHDTFVSIFDSGKSAFDRLRDTLKNGLLDMLYQMTIKKWIFNISASVTGGGMAGAAQAAGIPGLGGADLSSISGIASAAKAAYGAISAGFSGISTAVADGVQGMLYQSGATTQIASNGALANGAGAFAGYAAGAAVGVYGGRAISNGYAISGSGNGAVNAGTVIGAILGGPIGAAIGGLIGGAANRLFGRQERKVEDTWINGSFGASGAFSGGTDDWWREKGGTFRSDKTGVAKTPFDAAQTKALTDGYAALKMASADFATTLGFNADSIANRSQEMVFRLTKDEAENEALIAKFFTDVGDSMAKELVPNLAAFSKAGEGAAATLQRIASNYAFVDVALEAMGKTFGAVGITSVAAREKLLDLTGGIEGLGQGSAFFAANFLTEADRLAPVAVKLKASLADMGLAFVDSREELKQVVQGLNANNPEDAKTLASIFKIQEAFAAIYPAAEAANDAIGERADLQRQLDDLTLTSVQRLAKQRDALNASNRGLFDQIQAMTAAKAAQDAAKTSFDSLVGRMNTFGDAARALKDGLLTGSLSTLTPEQQEAELRRQYEATKAAAFGGDEKAQGNFNSIATAYLAASQKLNGGDSTYSAALAGVMRDADAIAQWSDGQIDIAQASLNAQEAQLAALMQLNSTMSSFAGGVNTGGAAVMVSNLGHTGESALVKEMQAMSAELAGLRADAAKQTGESIISNIRAQADAADAIVSGVTAGVRPQVTAKNSGAVLDN